MVKDDSACNHKSASRYSIALIYRKNRNEYQEHFLGGKGGRCIRLTTLPPSCAIVMKSGNLNFLEPSGPLKACNGTALLFFNTQKIQLHKYLNWNWMLFPSCMKPPFQFYSSMNILQTKLPLVCVSLLHHYKEEGTIEHSEIR